MPSRQLQTKVGASQRVLTIIWLALLVSVGIYALVAFVAVPGSEASPPDELETIAIALSVVALSTASASMVLPKILLSDEKLKAHLQGKTGASAEQRLASVSALYLPAWLIGVALAESVAIFGLVLAFIAGDPRFMVPFAIVGGVLVLLKRPRLAALIERVEGIG